MNDINGVLELVEGLSVAKKKDLVKQIMAMMESTPADRGCSRLVEEQLNGKPNCPHCDAQASQGFIVKRGHNRNGAQRYYCKNCGKIFVATTNTAFEKTRKDSDVWSKFIELTISGYSIEECKRECNICTQTAFTWRHKVLNAFCANQNNTKLTGQIEMDEMLIPISYKGNHIKGAFQSRKKTQPDQNTGLPRKAYKRGSDNVSLSSKQKACVICLIQDGGKRFYAGVPGIGFMDNSMLNTTLGSHVDREHAFMLVDQYKVTLKYLQDHNYEHLALASNTSERTHAHKAEIVDDKHLQHVNAMHSHIRRFLSKYCGVSSKYLENYISLFIWLQTVKGYKSLKRQDSASVGRAAMPDCYISRRALEARPAIPCGIS